LGEKTLQQGGTAAEITDDEEGFFNNLLAILRVEEVIQKEAQPGKQAINWENEIKQSQRPETFESKPAMGALTLEDSPVTQLEK
jgi:hypothetical protein